MMGEILVPDVIDEAQGLEQAVREELEKWEQIIHERLQAFYEIGLALQTIREKRLYRLEYETFPEYCTDRWEFSRQRADQLIASSSVVENLKQIEGGTQEKNATMVATTTTNGCILPQNERQARILARCEPGEQLEIWQEALETAPQGRVTAKHIQHIVAERHGPGADNRRDSYTHGGTAALPSTLCLFCREENVVVFPVPNARHGICQKCCDEAFAFHAQWQKEEGKTC